MNRQLGLVRSFPNGIPIRVKQRLQIVRIGDLDAFDRAARGDTFDL
jgi:hypothetical protein